MSQNEIDAASLLLADPNFHQSVVVFHGQEEASPMLLRRLAEMRRYVANNAEMLINEASKAHVEKVSSDAEFSTQLGFIEACVKEFADAVL